MAITVAADNTRPEDAEAVTGWVNMGAGGGAINTEPDVVYSGTFAASRKVGTSRAGRGWDGSADGPTSVDMTATDRRHTLFKVSATNFTALLSQASPGLICVIGTGTGDYYEFDVAGNDTYPAKGGFLLIPISPNVTGYRDTTTGTPGALTAVDFWGIEGDFSATSKSENVVIDAIDVGAGLTLTGDTPDGVWDDFVSHDEGTQANRYGYITETQGILNLLGRFAIGENTSGTAVSTDFTDSGIIAVWGNGYVETGFHELKLNLGNAGTAISHTGCTFISTGEKDNTVAEAGGGYTTTEDSRTNLTVSGTSGTGTFTGCTFKNFSDATLTTATTLDTCDIEIATFDDGGGAEIFDSVIRTTSITNVAAYVDPTFGTTTDLRDTEFIQAGAGHAIEFTTTGTKNLSGITFTGYSGTPGTNSTPASGSAAAAVFNDSGGAITINVTGGNSPSVRNGTGATTTVVNTVGVSVTVLDTNLNALSGARVFVEADAGGDLPSDDVVTITHVTTTASVSHTAHGMTAGQEVVIRDADQSEYNGVFAISNVSANAYDYTMSSDPGENASGTITSTALIFSETTNGSGIAENAGFAYTNDQPIRGRARLSTTAGSLYKTSPVTGTILNTGFSTTVLLISDE
jgi:hypothetical protein